MKSNPISFETNPMEKDRVYYFDVIDLIERYIDQVGITKTTADILTMLCNRLYDKLKIIGPALKENESHLSPDSIRRSSGVNREPAGGQ